MAVGGQGSRGHHQSAGEHGGQRPAQHAPLRIRLHSCSFSRQEPGSLTPGCTKRCRTVSIVTQSLHLTPDGSKDDREGRRREVDGGRGSRILEGHARVQAGPERHGRRHPRHAGAVGGSQPLPTDCTTSEALRPARSSERSSRAARRRLRRGEAERPRVMRGTARPLSRRRTSLPMPQAPVRDQPHGTESILAP